MIIILLSITLNAQNVWYVDRDSPAGLNGDGRSWATAWNYFDSTSYTPQLGGINWSILSPGDTIYVSGGTDSTNYCGITSEGIAISGGASAGVSHTFASGNPVVICPAWQLGHNGRVYFTTNRNDQARVFAIMNKSNVKITGFTFYDRRPNPTATTNLVRLGNGDWGDTDSLIYFENNHIISQGLTGSIVISGTKVTIRNCILENLPNDYAVDQDPMGMNSGRGGHTIDNNIIIMTNGNVGTDAHRDGIQISNIGYGETLGGIYRIERLPLTISNNLIIDTNPNGSSWNAMLYSSGPFCNQTFYVYNNIIVTRKWNTSITGIWIGKGGIPPWTSYKNSLYILNNTLIMKGRGDAVSGITAYNHDTLIIKNNLIVMDTSAQKFYNLDGSDGFPFCHKEIDYNHYAEYGGIAGIFGFDNALAKTYSEWRSTFGYDTHSSTGNSTAVTFSNKYGLEKDDYYTTTGRDLGADLLTEYPFLRYDILGNERTGSWDMGALEYVGNQSNNINVKSKIFLQGPFNINAMMTNLSQNGFIPNTQPFNTVPWNYNGSESLGSSSTSSYVDWVLVELRNSSNPTQVLARKAAILKNDGTLLNTDGSTSVPFNNIQEGSYYIAVFHRNHLAIMSANPVQLTANSPVYDFTNAINKAYGTNPMVDLGGGKFGMFAGDGNGDGGITITDRNEVWLLQNGSMGYLKGDFNLDGGVTASDVNLYWNINNGKMTQVP